MGGGGGGKEEDPILKRGKIKIHKAPYKGGEEEDPILLLQPHTKCKMLSRPPPSKIVNPYGMC